MAITGELQVLQQVPFAEDYLISSTGDVFKKTKKGLRQLKPSPDKDGYLRIVLRGKSHYQMSHSVHRLVLAAFIGVSELEVNHKDGNKANNTLDNLEYVTPSENVRHAYATGLKKPKTGKLVDEEVRQVRWLSENGVRARDIARTYSIGVTMVYDILRGDTYKFVKGSVDIFTIKK